MGINSNMAKVAELAGSMSMGDFGMTGRSQKVAKSKKKNKRKQAEKNRKKNRGR